MRVDRRIVEHRRHPIHQRVASRVFQPLGLGMHEIPRIVENADEKRFDDPVAAQDTHQ